MNEKAMKVLEYEKILQRLMDLTASELGKEHARELMPEMTLMAVERRLQETSDAVGHIMRKGTPPMGGIHDIRNSLKRVSLDAVLNPGELLKIADVLRACRNLKNYCGEEKQATNENMVSDLIVSLIPNKRIEDKISMVIVSEEEVSDSASPTLSHVRRHIRELQGSIKEKLASIVRSSKYQKFMQESIVTMRGDRYVVPVKQEFRNEIPGLVHDASSSGATIFIEPMAVVEANNEIKQLKIKEGIEIDRILSELTADVAEILPALISNISILGTLDFIFAKAKLSIKYQCVCPLLNREGKIVIKKGRHPLLDPAQVVPIDFWIGENFDSLIITGPNTGGKTVTLKTVGLFVLMAQSGLHIPANDGTKISIYEKVFADIGDEQSIEQSLSTFSSHMKNIVRILQQAQRSSLVLFDELGAGTDPTEGAALAMAILENLAQKKATVIATTHYSELKVYAISTNGVENACCEFDVDTLRPTYKLLIGIPGKSNAFAISSRLGLKDDVLGRAKEFLTQEDVRFEDVLKHIEKNRSEAEKDRISAQRYKLEIEDLKKELEEQSKKLNKQKEDILKEARIEARRMVIQAKNEAENLVEEMKRIEKEQEGQEKIKAAEEIRMQLRNKQNKMDESLIEPLLKKDRYGKPPKDLKPGDSVLIMDLNQKGTVINIPDKNGEAIIQVGIMKINVHVSNLKKNEEQTQEVQKRTGIGKIGKSKSGSTSLEIDLRGFSLDEAIESVDKYLDDASIAGLREVTIIHGKGTGVLRNGIHQFLKSNAHVKTFRIGKYGEGETGVTIAELK